MLDLRSPERIFLALHLIPASDADDAESPAKHARLAGEAAVPARRKILVVEDEFLLAAVLTQDLRDAGYDVVGPFPSLATAMAAADIQTFDAAILDINLRGELVYPVAEKLIDRQIPFIFLSGYAIANMPSTFQSYPRLAKPTEGKLLIQWVKRALANKLT